jgi:hypothetical protein
MANITINDNILRYPCPIIKTIKPISFDTCILIKNSKSFIFNEISELFKKNFSNYKHIIKYVCFDGYYGLVVTDIYKQYFETIYKNITITQHIINNTLVEFYKPVKIPCYDADTLKKTFVNFITIELKTIEHITINNNVLNYFVPLNTDIKPIFSMGYIIIKNSKYLDNHSIMNLKSKYKLHYKKEFNIIEIDGYYCMEFYNVNQEKLNHVYKDCLNDHYITCYKPVIIPFYSIDVQNEICKKETILLNINFKINDTILKYMVPVDTTITISYFKIYLIIKKNQHINTLKTTFNIYNIFDIDEYTFLEFNLIDEELAYTQYENYCRNNYFLCFEPVKIPIYDINTEFEFKYETIELKTLSIIKDNILKYLVPVEPDIEPIFHAHLIIIKNSELINNFAKEFLHFVDEHYNYYKSAFYIFKCGEQSCLAFNENMDDIVEKVYKIARIKKYIINNIHIDFYKPVKLPVYNFNNIIKSSKYESIELKTFDEKISYIFVDNSNIKVYTLKLYINFRIRKCVEILEKNTKYIAERNVVGSDFHPFALETWKELGYYVDNIPVDTKERSNDELLHIKLLNNIINNERPEISHLILATGDGNNHTDSCSFPSIIKFALDKGWTVDLYCWKKSVHHRFKQIQHDKFKINFMDDYPYFKKQLLKIDQSYDKEDFDDEYISDSKPEYKDNKKNCYIFVDKPNIFKIIKKENIEYYINTDNFKRVIERNTSNDTYKKTRYLIDKIINNINYKKWRLLKYNVHGSSSLDYNYIQILYSKIFNRILEYRDVEHNNKLIIASSGYITKYNGFSLYDIIKIALDKGWEVELHSWKHTVNNLFKNIKNEKFKIYFLDYCEDILCKKDSIKNPTMIHDTSFYISDNIETEINYPTCGN